ncbi:MULTISPECIES: DUF3152 domain-containing protein [unclassified Corynebacterium]|uniref:DUF3152 domain-containing protein n=1 Tax=unclassified Corynebacterium TaxID=2624378 RepID=UPI0026556D32|nr:MULTISPECIES: DUF3152 domain-containing protein [unclassified Corynebacterium]MDN8595153.1 DUF3152 domain-containing protein [Corynebacterium sp. P4_F2]WKK56613.1 DUF3152 domain-containing protein [Corynebacterium sp. P4-C1]WKK64050.1 DUF3152 domain-containing protein [Corynebacterium sp. P8-C1]
MTYHPDGRMDGAHHPAQGHRKAQRSELGRFVDTYGWRAYAIPVLVVVTALVIWSIVNTPEGETVGATSRAPQGTQVNGDSSRETVPDMPEGKVAMTELPPGGPFTEQGKGTYRPVGSLGMTAGEGKEKVVRFSTEVEDGIDTSSFGGDDSFAALVDATLSDPRGWTNDPKFRFEHVSASDNPDLRIQLTSVGTTRETCGNDLGLETSCRIFTEKDGDRVIINESRWVRGAAPYNGDLGMYRQYLINHEVGHALGYAAHEPCDGDGNLGPVMMQQTLSLNNKELFELAPEEVYPDNEDTCRANPWPYPRPTQV